MSKLLEYAKFIAALGGAGLIAAQQALPLSPVEHGWVSVALAVVTAALVYRVPNKKPENQ